MEKSIERIWKEGFMNNNLLSIPKIDDLESLKSIYFVDQFKKMYKTNIIGLALTAVLVLFAFMMGGVPFIGLFMFGLFASLAIMGELALYQLNQISLGKNNYEFLKTFDDWLKKLLARFSMVYRIWIPLLFIGFMLALLQTNLFIPFIGETLMDKILSFPNTYALGGLPVFWILGIVSIALVLSYFSDYFLKKEMKSVYGGILARLEKLLVEMEELR